MSIVCILIMKIVTVSGQNLLGQLVTQMKYTRDLPLTIGG